MPAGLHGKEEHDEKKPRRKLGWDERRDSMAKVSVVTIFFRHDATGGAPEPTRIYEDDNRRHSCRNYRAEGEHPVREVQRRQEDDGKDGESKTDSVRDPLEWRCHCVHETIKLL